MPVWDFEFRLSCQTSLHTFKEPASAMFPCACQTMPFRVDRETQSNKTALQGCGRTKVASNTFETALPRAGVEVKPLYKPFNGRKISLLSLYSFK